MNRFFFMVKPVHSRPQSSHSDYSGDTLHDSTQISSIEFMSAHLSHVTVCYRLSEGSGEHIKTKRKVFPRIPCAENENILTLQRKRSRTGA